MTYNIFSISRTPSPAPPPTTQYGDQEISLIFANSPENPPPSRGRNPKQPCQKISPLNTENPEVLFLSLSNLANPPADLSYKIINFTRKLFKSKRTNKDPVSHTPAKPQSCSPESSPTPFTNSAEPPLLPPANPSQNYVTPPVLYSAEYTQNHLKIINIQ